ncbi:DUF2164 family protein [Clostridium fermenticellae]|uniref:DUF2164 family protein n=1 Tax=Clostridium fermenticellae TaxID=2068654 RepID=A0A386H1K2_9CLOT|nr:DUF2164 domain-containing protein [Clostridium fermenticellae]AYD39448.1 DUF2164 family protein [Clostridium fermenticellae]
MRGKSKIKLSEETKREMSYKIKSYFLKERDEELGDLASSLILEFVIEELAPEFYNQGVYDSYKYMGEMVDDLLSIQKY